MSRRWERWIEALRVDVIEDEYGYEPGEFTVYPDHWRSFYKRGLTPHEAFKSALDQHGDARRKADAEARANWERIQAEDTAAPTSDGGE